MHLHRRNRPSAAAHPRLRLATLTLAIGTCLATSARAETFVVQNVDDAGAGSLRDAIEQANALPGEDTITFAPTVTGEILLKSQIRITDDLAIAGPGREALALDGRGQNRIFDIEPENVAPPSKGAQPSIAVSIEGLTLRNGRAQGKGWADSSGGCIRAEATALELVASRVTGCVASGGTGGGIATMPLDSDSDDYDPAGPTSLTLRNTQVDGNRADSYDYSSGGGISAAMIFGSGAEHGFRLIEGSSVTGNVASSGPGGGIEVFGNGPFDIEIRDSTFSGNMSGGFAGGGLVVFQPDPSSTTTIANSTFVANGLINGNASAPFAGGGGGAAIIALGQVRIETSRFEQNLGVPIAPPQKGFPTNIGFGGGLAVQGAFGGAPALSVDNSTFEANVGIFGAGLSFLRGSPTLPPQVAGKTTAHWSHSVVARVQRTPKGSLPEPGVQIRGSTLAGNIGFFAPAIAVITLEEVAPSGKGSVEIPVTFDGITVTGSMQIEGTPIPLPAVVSVTSGVTRLINSTLSGNAGGGIAAASTTVTGEALLVDNATIVNNIGAGILLPPSNSPELQTLAPSLKTYPPQTFETAVRNSIVHGNVDTDGLPQDFVGEPERMHLLHVLTSTEAAALAGFDGGGGNQFAVVDPLLGPLADNGGPTPTHLPLEGSPAIDAGDPDFATPPATDQRGESRVQGAAMDIGAVETLAIVLEPGVLQFDPSSATVDEAAGTVSLTVTRTGGSDGDVTADWATSDATAVAGTDYAASNGTLQWSDGDASAKTLTIPILDDDLAEDDETFAVALDAPTGGATLGTTDTAIVTIVSDDAPGMLRFTGADPDGVLRLRVDENGALAESLAKGQLVLSVERTGSAGGTASVNYATADGTATAPSDYVATSGTLTWDDGDAGERLIPLTIVEDETPPEPDETFRVVLSGAQGAGLESLQAEITIVANGTVEPPPPPPSMQPTVIPTHDWRGRFALLGAMLLGAFVALRRRFG